MKINNNLNVYDDNENKDLKVIYKVAIIIFVILTLITILLTIFFNHLYPTIICFVLGSIISYVLFMIIERQVYASYYEDLPKTTRRIHKLHQIVYLLSFIIVALIFKDVFAVLALMIGLFLMKISIFITNTLKSR